jgi:hypothetical protein
MSNPTAALTVKNPAKKTIRLTLDGKTIAKRVVGFARQYTQALITIGSGGGATFQSCTAKRGSLNATAAEINASPVNWSGSACRALVLDIVNDCVVLCPLAHAQATAAAAIDAATPAAVAKRAHWDAQDARDVVERTARIAAEAAELAADPAKAVRAAKWAAQIAEAREAHRARIAARRAAVKAERAANYDAACAAAVARCALPAPVAAPAPVAEPAPVRAATLIDIAYTTRDDAMRAAYATRDAARRAAEHAARADDRACDDAIAAAGAAFSAAFAHACAVRDAAEAANAAETAASAERDAEDAERLATDAEDAGSPDAPALRAAAIAAADRSARVAEAHAAYAAEPADFEPDRVADCENVIRWSGKKVTIKIDRSEQIGAFDRAHAEAADSDAACHAAQDERERWEGETLARRSDGRIY